MEIEKEGSVQSLREKTLKFDCVKGMEYRGVGAKFCARFKGIKLGMGVLVGLMGVGLFRVWGVST